jgi:5-methylcytosine-specific restriction endonuclease McrA
MPKTSKKPTRSKLVKKLDVVFSKYIRLSNADSRGFCTCITCGKKGYWEKDIIDAGHFISRTAMATRWDPRNVKPQCRYCNRFKAGRQYEYSLYLGDNLSQELLEKSREVTKFTTDELEEMITEYSSKLKSFL